MSASGRVKLNRTIPNKDGNSLPRKRRSLLGKVASLGTAVNQPNPHNHGAFNTSVEGIESASVQENMTKRTELSSTIIQNEQGMPKCPVSSDINFVIVSPSKTTEVQLQQAPEEDKETPSQAEGFCKGTEQPLDHNFPCEQKRRGAKPVHSVTAFGDICERSGGPRTRSKSASGEASFKACQLGKMKSERVKRHEKQVCCRLAFALCIIGEDSNKIQVSKPSRQSQARSKPGNVFVGSGNNRGRRKDNQKRKGVKASTESARQAQIIRGGSVKAKKKRSNTIKLRKRLRIVDNNDTVHVNMRSQHPAYLESKTPSRTRVSTKRRRTKSTIKTEKAEEACGLCIWGQTKGDWYTSRVTRVRSSRHGVGTAKKDAKSSECMTLTRRKRGRNTENRINKVPAGKPSTDGHAAFHLNSQQVLTDHCGENNNKRFIKSSCCTTCCEVKYTPSRIYSSAKVGSSKPCRILHKGTSDQGLNSRNNGVEKDPFVNLCDFFKAPKSLVYPIDSTYVLTEELKINNVRCFKGGHGDLMPLGIQAGPCASAEASIAQNISMYRNHSATRMISHSPEDMPKVVNEPSVVGIAETLITQAEVGFKQAEKRMRLSGDGIGDIGQDSESLLEFSAAVQPGCSTAVPTSSDKRETVKNTSSGNQDVLLECCKNNDDVQDNISTMAKHKLMAEESKSQGESAADSSVDAEMGHEMEGLDSVSCQRTTPFLVRDRQSCARAYISWPFQERVSSGKIWNVSVTGPPASGPSTSTSSSFTLTCSPVFNSSVPDTPVSQILSHSCEMPDSFPPQDEASDVQASTERVRTSEKNENISEKHCVPDTPSLVNGSGMSAKITAASGDSGLTAKAVEPQRGSSLCSHVQDHPTEVIKEKVISTVERVEPQACEPDILWRQKMQHFKIPLKRTTSSMERVKNQPSLHSSAQRHQLNGTVEFPCLLDAGEKHTTPASLAHVDQLPCLNRTLNLRAPLEVRKTSHGSSEDDASSVSSGDELVAEELAPCGEIMCEIQDAHSTPCQDSSFHSSTAEEEGTSREAMDLLKAYEQDAIVLDVIQDDPELFGNVPVEQKVTTVGKSASSLVSRAIHPVKSHDVKNNLRIIKGCKLSVTRNGHLGQQALKMVDGARISAVEIGGNWEGLHSNGERPFQNGLAEDGFHIKSSILALKGTQKSVCEWNWTDFKTSVERDSGLHSSTSDPAWNDALEGDLLQANVGKDLSPQGVPWPAGSFCDLSDASEKYCKFYFSDQHVCFRKTCWFLHIPIAGDEKFCIGAVQRFCSVENGSHLLRAAAVFAGYYQKCTPGVHFNLYVLNSLLSALLSKGLVKDLLSVLRVMIPYKILPPVEFILSVFEHVNCWGLRVAVPDLIEVTTKSVEAGLVLTLETFDNMKSCLEVLQTPCNQMEVFLSVQCRVLESSIALNSDVGELAVALTEVECCKEQQDWAKLAGLFCSVCSSNLSLADLNCMSGSIAVALLRDTPPNGPLPFCQFVEAVSQGSFVSGLVKSLLGRIGLSLMFRYHKTQQWTKGKKLLDTLNVLNVNYSMLKGLFAGESSVSRCRIISMAAEVFLSCGGMEGALSLMKDNKWILSSPLWQCEEADVAHRRSVLFHLAEATTQNSMFEETLEVLTKLPNLQDPNAAETSQYNLVFHRHLKTCLEKLNLTVASNMVDLMLMHKISVDVDLLRLLIHKLGKKNAWQKARSLYKGAVSIGCYPQTQVNKYCRILPVPYSMSEIEMTLSLEMFMVSNASDIQNPGFFPHALQIVLKRKGSTEVIRESDYQAARSRLLTAAQTADPKLVIKYATVNPNQEQVFTLDSLSALKWLTQNMNWASEVWLPSDSIPESNISPQPHSA